MESAIITHVDWRGFGFARVINCSDNHSEIKEEEIYFRLECGRRVAAGRKIRNNKPKFNNKTKFNGIPDVGTIIVFVRKKTPQKNLKDSAKIWGLKNEYKKIWAEIDKNKKKAERLQSLELALKKISAESRVG